MNPEDMVDLNVAAAMIQGVMQQQQQQLLIQQQQAAQQQQQQMAAQQQQQQQQQQQLLLLQQQAILAQQAAQQQLPPGLTQQQQKKKNKKGPGMDDDDDYEDDEDFEMAAVPNPVAAAAAVPGAEANPVSSGPTAGRAKRARKAVNYSVGDDEDDIDDEQKFLSSLRVGNSLKGYDKYEPPPPKKPKKKVADGLVDTSGTFHFDTEDFDMGQKYEIQEDDGSWRGATLYKHKKSLGQRPQSMAQQKRWAFSHIQSPYNLVDGGNQLYTVVIWFEADEYEGMDGKYTLDDAGVLRDSDGDTIECRKVELPLSKQYRMLGDYVAAAEAIAQESAAAAKS